MQHEAKVGQTFSLDLVLDIDLTDASRSDKLADTVGYDQVVEIASKAFCARRYRLVEAAAGAVAAAVLDRFPRVARGAGHGAQAARADRGDLRRCRGHHRARSLVLLAPMLVREHAADGLRHREPGLGIMAEALVAFGGNVGDVRATLDRAVAAFCDGAMCASSPAPRTIARRPGASRTSRRSSISASRLKPTSRRMRCLTRAQAVERAFGRDRAQEQRWGPRPVDIDLLAYDDIDLERAETHAAAPASVRARFRAGPARGDCA